LPILTTTTLQNILWRVPSSLFEDKVYIELPSDPLLSAEAKLNLSSFRFGINGDWLIDSVTHSIDKITGFVSSLEGVKNLDVDN
jgi:hypothetical protein